MRTEVVAFQFSQVGVLASLRVPVRLLCVVLCAAVAACGDAKPAGQGGGSVTLTRDASVGAKFGAPGPRSCSSTTQPTSGPISPAQARAYVICGHEMDYQGGSESLYLIGHVQVQVASGRPYEHVRDSLEQIDPHKQVYDIRGSSVGYQCSLPSKLEGAPQLQPCRRTVEQNDKGLCYQTTFNEWRCTWGDLTAPMSIDTRTLVSAPAEADVE